MKPITHPQAGFSLIEVLIALTLGAIILLSAERVLPLLWQQTTAMEHRQWVRTEMQRLLLLIEKAIRRAGFCHGESCRGISMEIMEGGKCLLLRWDDNANGQWEGPSHQHSDYFGYRHRGLAIESARGVTDCSSGQWSRLTQPAQVQVLDFQVKAVARQVDVQLTLKAGKYTLNRQHRVNREND
ncbi:prepilin peptidase-dependent protein [Rosenbergiella nectarea]|uniref:prepilin peptidase-dependent protein n=1 Tax=Rosenbergiella nectarea TaxID=988801 RepID=UPI001F4E582B|nr:prepilin peptidase-dependent protein [Rosenbergiella nectarea]